MATALDMNTFTMNTADPQQFLKLEDLHTAASPSPDLAAPSSSPHPTVLVKSKPAKKRKSWGQELPEPKTTLPPRKRAKTDDEKEQRRIERIKRNRAAAHNSRERKRQETDTLAVALAKANAQLDAYRRLHGPLPASVILPDIRLVDDDADTPAPSLGESYGTVEAALSPDSPEDDDLFEDHIKQEPADTSYNTTLLQPNFENLDAKALPLSPLDPIQHSAAMLSDLQCRSSTKANSGTNLRSSNFTILNNNFTSKTTTPPSASHIPWAQLILHLMSINLQICYKTLLVAMWSLSPSQMARSIQASTLRLTSRSTTSSTTLAQSTALAQRKAATGRLAAKGALVALQRWSGGRLEQKFGELRSQRALLRERQKGLHWDQSGGGV